MVAFGAIIGVLASAIARGIVGWLKPALADKKIDEFEWKKLFETIIVISVTTLAVYLPVNYFDVLGDPEVISIVAGFLVHELWNEMKKRKVKKK